MNDLIKTLTGTLFLFLYCLCTALSAVLIDITERGVSMEASLFYSFLISLLFCHIINLFRFKKYRTVLWQQRNNIIVLNITTTIVWVGVFYALLIVSPAIVTSLYLGAIPLATFFLQYSQLKSMREKISNGLFIFLIALILLLLIIDDLKQITVWNTSIVAMLGCGICAIAGAVSNIKAKAIAAQKIPASIVLATRVYLTVIFAALILFWHHDSFIISRHAWLDMIIIAASSLVIPLFLLQKGLERVDPLYTSILLPFIPVMTFCLQLLSPLYHFAWLEFILIALLAIVIGVSVVVKMKREK